VCGLTSSFTQPPENTAKPPWHLTIPHQPVCGKTKRPRRGPAPYREFSSAAEAIRFAVENMPALSTLGIVMQVKKKSFSRDEITRLYERNDYPLRREWA